MVEVSDEEDPFLLEEAGESEVGSFSDDDPVERFYQRDVARCGGGGAAEEDPEEEPPEDDPEVDPDDPYSKLLLLLALA